MKRNHLIHLESKILNLRTRETLLDRDLAEALDVKTAVINQIVSRHTERFPEAFSFPLKKKECDQLVKDGVLTKKEVSARNKPPRVFTEAGAYMIAFLVPTEPARKLSQLVLGDLTAGA